MKIVNCKLSIVNCCSIAAMISFALFILSFAIDVEALRMTNSEYIIQSDINAFGGKATGNGVTLKLTGGQNAPGLYSGTNYKVRSGFQYIFSTTSFTFSISTTEINLGTIVPGEPVTRTNTLTVSTGSTKGYQVTLEENHQLMTSTNLVIPDTTCDAGTCTETTAANWTSPLTYGFGYRCDNVSGKDCSTSFTSNTSYKQFANRKEGENSQIVMTGQKSAEKNQATITYKVNLAANQPPGLYQNIIKYIATPSI